MSKFSGKKEDWDDFKGSLISTLAKKDLWGVISGEVKADDTLEYKSKNQRAFGFMTSDLDISTKKLIRVEDEEKADGIKAWKRLLELFEKKNEMGLLGLRIEFNKIRMKKGETIDSYLNRTIQLVQQMKAIDEDAIRERDVVQQILSGLPEEYNFYVFGKGKEFSEIKLEEVQEELKAMSIFQKEREEAKEEEKPELAMYGKYQNQYRGRGSGRGFTRDYPRSRGNFYRGRGQNFRGQNYQKQNYRGQNYRRNK